MIDTLILGLSCYIAIMSCLKRIMYKGEPHEITGEWSNFYSYMFNSDARYNWLIINILFIIMIAIITLNNY